MPSQSDCWGSHRWTFRVIAIGSRFKLSIALEIEDLGPGHVGFIERSLRAEPRIDVEALKKAISKSINLISYLIEIKRKPLKSELRFFYPYSVTTSRLQRSSTPP